MENCNNCAFGGYCTSPNNSYVHPDGSDESCDGYLANLDENKQAVDVVFSTATVSLEV